MVRRLTKLKIREVSAVDRGAGEGTRVVLWKRHDDDFDRDPARTDTAESNEDGGAGERENENLYENRQEHEQESDITATSVMPPRLQEMVDAVRIAAPSMSEGEIVHFLTMTARGRRVAEHLSNVTRKEKREMSRSEKLQALAKRGGVQLVAKALLAKGDAMEVSEFEFTELMKAEAAREGVSFTKYFEAPENVDIRRAWQMTKSTLVAKDTLLREVEVEPTVSAEDSEEAYRQLMAMAERLATQGKYRSVSQAFAALFSDQKNAELAARANRHRVSESM